MSTQTAGERAQHDELLAAAKKLVAKLGRSAIWQGDETWQELRAAIAKAERRGAVMDFTVINHGSLVALRPETDAAREWLDENVKSEGWQRIGRSLMVEPRYVQCLLNGILESGLTL